MGGKARVVKTWKPLIALVLALRRTPCPCGGGWARSQYSSNKNDYSFNVRSHFGSRLLAWRSLSPVDEANFLELSFATFFTQGSVPK
eukprot:759439-Amphidinium_carterae.1